ncbi:cutl-20 [Pristionchus pacificus]|nr:cutl-20 [Pristionchus pacificus]|eukprot:PDM66635.1 cutl-20 [Pristionchus pacificus]
MPSQSILIPSILLTTVLATISALPSILHTSIACDKSDFVLKIKFNESFQGLIYTEKGEPNCVYADGSVQSKSSYALKIPLSGCETRRNAEGHFENELVVQGGKQFNSREDKKFLLTCIPAQPQNSQVTLSFGGVTVAAPSTTASSVASKAASIDYSVSVLDGSTADSPPLARPLAVGDRVTYMVKLASPAKARIGRCWATDSKTSLLLAGANGERVFLNHIKAWAFPTSNEVNIFCNLHVCPTCEQPSCSRRPTRSQGESMEEGDTVVEVINSFLINGDSVVDVMTSFRLRRQSPDALQSLQRDEIITAESEDPLALSSIDSANFAALPTLSLFFISLLSFLIVR